MICRNVVNDHLRQTPGYHPNCRNFQSDRIHQDTDKSLLPPATKLGQGYVFTGVCDSVHRGACMVAGGCAWLGGHAWLPGACVVARECMVAMGVCVVAGGHVWLWGACVVAGGCAWLPGGLHGCGRGEACVVASGVHGCRGHMWLQGGHVWLQGACVGYDVIRSMSGRYASYWNAFLLLLSLW